MASVWMPGRQLSFAPSLALVARVGAGKTDDEKGGQGAKPDACQDDVQGVGQDRQHRQLFGCGMARQGAHRQGDGGDGGAQEVFPARPRAVAQVAGQWPAPLGRRTARPTQMWPMRVFCMSPNQASEAPGVIGRRRWPARWWWRKCRAGPAAGRSRARAARVPGE